MRLTAFKIVVMLPGTLAVASAQCPPDQAQYELRFDSTWSAVTHPQDFPASPHFSGLVGGVHDTSVALWQVGALASDGIERMAELGSKTVLIAEVNTAIAAGSAAAVVSGGGIGVSPGSVSVTFSASRSHPLATVVSMLAPSPDWFVGVNGLNLFEDGNWAEERVVELAVYDAGTDSGFTYTSPNSNTNPAEPISEILGYPFVNGAMQYPVGTFTFERLSATCSDGDGDQVADDIDNCTLLANPAQRDTDGDSIGNACDPDIAPSPNDCQVSFSDLQALKSAFFSEPGLPAWNPDADLVFNDRVDFADANRMRELFFGPPGPSAGGACE